MLLYILHLLRQLILCIELRSVYQACMLPFRVTQIVVIGEFARKENETVIMKRTAITSVLT